MQAKLSEWFHDKCHLSDTNVILALSAVVGLATAFGAIIFIRLIQWCNHVFLGLTPDILTQAVGFGQKRLWIPLIPMLGGVLVGPIVYKFASEARGHGVPEVMNAVTRMGGIIRNRVAVAKTVASAICIGSGGSAGREGPIVQIGSALGSSIGQMFRFSGDRVKILVGCGAAAGISAVFNAPIAGVFFSLEIILGDFAIKTFAPVLLSSVIASVVSRAFLGDHPAFAVAPYSLVSAWEIPLYIIMGSIIGVVGVAFTRLLEIMEDGFEKLKVPDVLKPAVGGLLLGIIGAFYPQTLADGYSTIRLTLLGDLSITLMLILIVLKLLATCLTLGSGNSGGIFAPSLFTGAVAGGSFGYLMHILFPSVTATHGAYALVGMAGMIAAATHAPITALIIIYEMTRDYRIILPLMVTVVFSALVARRLFAYSIYTVKLARRGIEIRGGRDINVLKSHRVSEIMEEDFEIIPSQTPLAQIFAHVERSRDSYFIVVDPDGDLRGVLSFQDIRSLLTQHTLDNLIIARDVVSSDTLTLLVEDDLDTASKKFGTKDLRLIPVVERSNPKKVIGVVRRDTLRDYYNRRLIETLRQ